MTHEQLWAVCKRLPTDFDPYGQQDREAAYEAGASDCSSGCIWFHELSGKRGYDWGVCGNPKSPRAGLLTFEHQGCLHFELKN